MTSDRPFMLRILPGMPATREGSELLNGAKIVAMCRERRRKDEELFRLARSYFKSVERYASKF